MFSHSKVSDSLPLRLVPREKVELPLFIHPSDVNHLIMYGKEKSDFIVKYSPDKNKKSSHRKFIHRKFAQHSFAFLPSSFFHPISLSRCYILSLFHFSCRKKRLQWIEREKFLLIFDLMLFYRKHFNSFVTIFRSNKPFLCIWRGWKRTNNLNLDFWNLPSIRDDFFPRNSQNMIIYVMIHRFLCLKLCQRIWSFIYEVFNFYETVGDEREEGWRIVYSINLRPLL